MFKPVSSKLNANAMELSILEFWKKEDIFHVSTNNREGKPEYVFYEGPPTANGIPGVHHVLARAFKDIFPRYKTMQGFHVSRRGGWDTHGLPVEIEVEKKLGFKNKQQIEEFGIAEFNHIACVHVNQVVVLHAPVCLFKLGNVLAKLMLHHQAAIEEQLYGIVQSSPANPVVFVLHEYVEGLNIEVAVSGIDFSVDSNLL